MRNRHAAFTIAAALLGVISISGVQGAEVTYKSPGRPPSAEEKAFFIALIESSREKVKSGEYFLEGNITSKEWREPVAIQIHATFDRPRGLQKFDEELPIAEADNAADPDRYRAIAVQRPDITMEWMNGSYGTANLILEDAAAKQNDMLWLPDIRVVGLQNIGVWLEQRNTLSDTLGGLRNTELLSVEEVNGKPVVITDWLFVYDRDMPSKKPSFLYRLHFSTTLNYALVKREAFGCFTDASGKLVTIADEPMSECELTWKQHDDVVVPISVKGWDGPRSQRNTYDLSVDWKRINVPIDATEFDKDGLGLAADTPVFDKRKAQD